MVAPLRGLFAAALVARWYLKSALWRQGGYLEIALDPLVNRTGDAWHILVEGLRDISSLAYGWRADAADISRFYPGAAPGGAECRVLLAIEACCVSQHTCLTRTRELPHSCQGSDILLFMEQG